MSQDTRSDRPRDPRSPRPKPQDDSAQVPGPPKSTLPPPIMRELDQMAEKAGDFLKNLIQTEGQVVQVGEGGGGLAPTGPAITTYPFTGEVYPDAPGLTTTVPSHNLAPLSEISPGLASLIRDMEGFLAVEVPRGLSPAELAPAITQFITRLKEI